MAFRSPPPGGRLVPQSRLARLARIGSAAAGVSGNMLVQGTGRLLRGQAPALSDLLLTPANITRVTDELARLRGAAMKLGQLVSMDAGRSLPPELAVIMARLRNAAEPMPEAQLQAVLDANWGAGWHERLAEFHFEPMAAASIGEVHRAKTHDGRVLAIKVQYPGVRESIESDVDNVGTLLRLTGLVPSGIDTRPLLAEAKRQLREEADYRSEARYLQSFAALLGSDDAFVVPALVPEFSTDTVLAMQFVDSVPIETLDNASQATCDRVAAKLIELFLRELFEFGLMQTDPNFANYRFQPESGRIVLLDFGASRAFAPELVARFKRLLQAGLEGDRTAARQAMLDIGILENGHPRIFEASVLVMVDTIFRAIRSADPFDFADSSLVEKLENQGRALTERRDALRAPPADVLFLQRKLGGLFLLATRLKARVPLAQMLQDYADR
jgi:predicted unusual protein kinase regulating ubiquinone biosynthesis (AarF/ABC1/UbiB family)